MRATRLGGVHDPTVLGAVAAGLGYEAALLGRLALQVWTVELFPELAAMARSNLARSGTGTGNVTISPGGPG